jgi:hypothetical protein
MDSRYRWASKWRGCSCHFEGYRFAILALKSCLVALTALSVLYGDPDYIFSCFASGIMRQITLLAILPGMLMMPRFYAWLQSVIGHAGYGVPTMRACGVAP